MGGSDIHYTVLHPGGWVGWGLGQMLQEMGDEKKTVQVREEQKFFSPGSWDIFKIYCQSPT